MELRLSIVVPALNEEDNVAKLVEEVRAKVLEAGVPAELIIVDDGSTDRTPAALAELAGRYAWVRPLRREKAQGQSAAMAAGILAARAPWVGMLDADLQNDPADLPRFLALQEKSGVDMVQGARLRRQDNPIRKFSSWVGRSARRLLLGDVVRDTGCSTRVLRRELALQLPLQFKGMHRFIPAFVHMIGGKIEEAHANHRPRTAGTTKYGVWNRAWVGLHDCFAMRWMLARKRDVSAAPIAPTVAAGQGVRP